MLPKSRSAFSKWCSALTKGWQDGHRIPKALQDKILEGFRKYYDRRSWKYKLICNAVGIRYYRTISKSWTFALVNPDGTTTTVSKSCKRLNLRHELTTACRGAVHHTQILPCKTFKASEIDHCNEGGFVGIFNKWVEGQDLRQLFKYVERNDPREVSTAVEGFVTLREPKLTEWRVFHKAHAQLQELTREEHARITKRRL